MSSPGSYWGDEDFNSAVLSELAVIEANQIASTSRSLMRRSPSPPKAMPPLSTNPASDDVYDLFNVDIQDFQELDAAIEKDLRRKEAAPTSKSPTFGRSLSGRQTTLFGNVLSPSPKKPSSSRRGAQQRSPERSTDRKIKKWDHTAFSKTGTKRKTGKRKAKELDEDADEEDAVEFEQFPAPFVAGKLVIRASRELQLTPSRCSWVSRAHGSNSPVLMVHASYYISDR